MFLLTGSFVPLLNTEELQEATVLPAPVPPVAISEDEFLKVTGRFVTFFIFFIFFNETTHYLQKRTNTLIL